MAFECLDALAWKKQAKSKHASQGASLLSRIQLSTFFTMNFFPPQLHRILINLVWSGFLPLCTVFQLFRLASLVMFSIFLFDCILYHDTTSVDCIDFTVYNTSTCDPYCWKTVWLVCSILTSTVYMCLLNRTMLPELRPVGNKVQQYYHSSCSSVRCLNYHSKQKGKDRYRMPGNCL